MSAYGTMPFGTGPFGLGTPTSLTAPPTGTAGVRYLNPASRDYEVDPATGQLAQMPSIRQRVLLAVTTLFRSSTAVPTFGIKLPRKMGTTFPAEADAAVRSALRHLTETEALIRINSVTTERYGGRARITVAWTDLSTGLEDRTEI